MLMSYAAKEARAVVVFAGVGAGGKTTNLTVLHHWLAAGTSMLNGVSTRADRTLFLDLLPVGYGKRADWSVKMDFRSVPGQVEYQAGRADVLRAADVCVFVADARERRLSANRLAMWDLERALRSVGREPGDVGLVIQWNKLDRADALPIEVLEYELNPGGAPSVPARAIAGVGVRETFRLASEIALRRVDTALLGQR
jgi:hypothetical protein